MSNTTLKPEEIATAKAKGFLLNRDTNKFNGRIIAKNSVISAEELQVITDAAKKFGNGTVSFTVRLNIEVPGIDYEHITDFCDFIAKANLQTGGTGNKVRPTVACKGTTCVFGLYDTQKIAFQIHEKFYNRDFPLPYKFKITAGGCPNNCAKTNLNDIGLMGQRLINYDLEICKGCKKCGVSANCPMKAASVQGGKLTIDKTLCNNCGRCLHKCPFGVSESYEDKIKIFIGGRWGKNIRIGTPLDLRYNCEEALQVIDKALNFYKENGLEKERFSQTIERLGEDFVFAALKL